MSKNYDYFYMVYRMNRKNKRPPLAYYQALKTCRKCKADTPSYEATLEHERKRGKK